MGRPQELPLEHYLDAEDILLVVGPGTSIRPEIFLAMQADGTARAFSGHVDLGTGIRTALAQIVAEELDIPVERVSMVLGTTTLVTTLLPLASAFINSASRKISDLARP